MDKWDEVREGIRKFEQSPVMSEELLKAMDHISLVDYWKRRAEEERELLTSLRRHLEDREKDFQLERSKTESLERSFEDKRRIWEKEREALEEKIKAREKEIELLRERAEWETKFQDAIQRLSGAKKGSGTLREDGDEDIYVSHELRRIAKEILSLKDSVDVVQGTAGWLDKEKGRFLDLLGNYQTTNQSAMVGQMKEMLEKVREQLTSFKDELYKKLEDKVVSAPKETAAGPAVKGDTILMGGVVPSVESGGGEAVKKWMERLQDFHWGQEDSARGFCHKARNLLGIISGTAQISLTDEKINPEMKENLTTIDQNATLLLNSIEEYLAITKYPQMNYEEIDMNALLQELAVGPQYKFELGTGLPKIKVDKNLIKDALSCVLTNAKEAGAPDGSPVEIRTSVDEAEKSLLISVKDAGKGIGDNHLKKVFQPYFTTKKDQRGLGLSKTRHYVSLHGGKSVVESTKGAGATIKIWLPIV